MGQQLPCQQPQGLGGLDEALSGDQHCLCGGGWPQSGYDSGRRVVVGRRRKTGGGQNSTEGQKDRVCWFCCVFFIRTCFLAENSQKSNFGRAIIGKNICICSKRIFSWLCVPQSPSWCLCWVKNSEFGPLGVCYEGLYQQIAGEWKYVSSGRCDCDLQWLMQLLLSPCWAKCRHPGAGGVGKGPCFLPAAGLWLWGRTGDLAACARGSPLFLWQLQIYVFGSCLCKEIRLTT